MGSDKPKDRRREAWSTWLGKLSPEAQSSLTNPPPSHLAEAVQDYAAWRERLSDYTRERVDELVEMEDEPADLPPTNGMKYGLVVVPDGEIPSIHGFRTVDALVKYMAKLEGQDVHVCPFQGSALVFTKGPQRFLRLADRETLLSIPRLPGLPLSRIDSDDSLVSDLVDEEYGYLGPDEMTEPTVIVAQTGKAKKVKSDDGEEEEGPEEQGQHAPR